MAAAFYAINVPFSKLLLNHIGPTTMAALLYLGAGIGVGLMSIGRNKGEKLNRNDLPYVIGMIVLDIAAPIFLMFGISLGQSSNASLLGNFEIVATTVIALIVFKEAVSKRLWGAFVLITLSSILLSFEGTDSFRFSYGSSNKEYEKYQQYQTDKLHGRILTPDGLRVICAGLDNDPEKIGIHMLEMLAKFRNEGIVE